MERTTSTTTAGTERRYGARQPVGVDVDPSRRPGVPRLHAPQKLPNTRFPPEPQRSRATVFMHGRPHKTFPPGFGTGVPPKGLSGLVRRAAYHYPDHYMRHWTMLLFADRVDLWEHRARKALRLAAPALVALAAVRAGLRAVAR
jgi:hypothetical protein